MYVSHGPSNDMPYSIVVVSGTSTVTAVASVTGQIIRVYALFIVPGAAATLTFQDSTAVQSGAVSLAQNAVFTLGNSGTPWFITAPGASFQIVASAGTIAGTVYYTQSKFGG